MRSPFARLAALSALAIALAACSNTNGSGLPFAGPPNNSGGTPGTIQSGSNGSALLRFVNGSPDFASVDVCVDNLPFGITTPNVAYGSQRGLYNIAGGITHTISVFPAAGANAGQQCATAPGPYFGTQAISVSTLSVGNNVRWTIVFGGTATSGTRGLYIFGEPSFAIAPAGPEAISHNAAPAFSIGKPNGVGFGQCTTTAVPCATPVALAGAAGVAVAKPSSATASTVNSPPAPSPLSAVPAGFYDGIGVSAGAPVPITSIPAPTPVAGQPYVVELYAFDAPAGGLNLLGVVEQTLGVGF